MSKPRSDQDLTGSDEAHDVLAAEEFAMPTADPTIHPAPVVLPGDPTGIVEAHDVLAAEEFAMPALPIHPDVSDRRRLNGYLGGLLATGLLVLALLVRHRRR